MGYTPLAPTRTSKSGWEGGHWDKERGCPGCWNSPEEEAQPCIPRWIINPCPTFLQWTCLLQAHPKMPLGGSLMQKFSPTSATRSSEMP